MKGWTARWSMALLMACRADRSTGLGDFGMVPGRRRPGPPSGPVRSGDALSWNGHGHGHGHGDDGDGDGAQAAASRA
jgi:hypothetical protein